MRNHQVLHPVCIHLLLLWWMISAKRGAHLTSCQTRSPLLRPRWTALTRSRIQPTPHLILSTETATAPLTTPMPRPMLPCAGATASLITTSCYLEPHPTRPFPPSSKPSMAPKPSGPSMLKTVLCTAATPSATMRAINADQDAPMNASTTADREPTSTTSGRARNSPRSSQSSSRPLRSCRQAFSAKTRTAPSRCTMQRAITPSTVASAEAR